MVEEAFAAKSRQSCLTLCDPIDGNPPGSPAPGKPEGRHYCFLKEEAEKATQVLTWLVAAAAAAKSLQSCLTLCDPIDGSPPGSPIPGILQARTLEWVAISFSNA